MGRTTNGADVGQWSNTTSYNSHWELIQYSGNYYQLRNRSTGLYLDGMGRTTNGDAAGQWANTTHVNSQWEMISTSGNRLADESEVFAKEQVQFYPNPINEKLYINLGSTTNAELKLLDTSGKVLRSHKVGTIETINVAQLKPGIYLLEISTPDQTIRSKVIKTVNKK